MGGTRQRCPHAVAMMGDGVPARISLPGPHGYSWGDA